MNTLQGIFDKAQSLGIASSSIPQLEKVLSKYKDRPIHLEFLNKLLESEIEKNYFEVNHFKQTYKYKDLLNYTFTQDTSTILGLIFPYKNGITPTNPLLSSLNNKDSINRAVESLNDNGYWVSPIQLDESIIDSIVGQLSDIQFFMRGKLKTVKGYQKNKAESISSNAAWVIDQQDILNIDEVQRLVIDPFLQAVTGQYLSGQPIHVQSNCWWSTAFETNKTALSANAQLFHQDKEFVKFLKLFLYLNDVDETNGAHVYVSGSHRDNRFETEEGYKISSRLSDEEIANKYDPEDILTMKGKKGTIILEDTSGFHKGTPVLKGHRLLLQLEFTNSLFFNPVNAYDPDNVNNDLKEYIEANKRFSLNYNKNNYKRDISRSKKARFKKNLKGKIKSLIKGNSSN